MNFAQHPVTRLFWNGKTFAASFATATPLTRDAARFLGWLHNAVTVTVTIDG
jgi:hypothetical protein